MSQASNNILQITLIPRFLPGTSLYARDPERWDYFPLDQIHRGVVNCSSGGTVRFCFRRSRGVRPDGKMWTDICPRIVKMGCGWRRRFGWCGRCISSPRRGNCVLVNAYHNSLRMVETSTCARYACRTASSTLGAARPLVGTRRSITARTDRRSLSMRRVSLVAALASNSSESERRAALRLDSIAAEV